MIAARRAVQRPPGARLLVIDRQGTVRHVFNSQLRATQHVKEAMAALRELSTG